MRNDRGITLVILILYIIVTIIVISMLSMLIMYFRNNLGDLDEKSVQEAEFNKINLYLLEETKNENNFVVAITEGSKLELFNGNTYTFVKSEKAIYLNDNIKIAQGIESCNFSYVDDERKEKLIVSLTINGQEQTTEYIFEREIFLVEPGEVAITTSIYRNNNKAAIIPEGFAVSGIEGEQGITTGLVIYSISKNVDTTTEDFWTKDENENNYADVMEAYEQFVWIPVNNINDVYMCQSENGLKSCKISVENDQAICKTHNSTLMAGRLYTSTLLDTNQKYEGKLVREPDIVTGNDTTYYTKIEDVLKLGWTSVDDFKTFLQEEYNDVVKSVYINRGFYIGKFRSSKTSVSKYETIDNQDWYDSYAKLLQSNIGDKTKITMVQGAAFDHLVKFTDAYNTEDSILNNIYDLRSGNTWTTEKYNDNIRREVRTPSRAGGGATRTSRARRAMMYIIN